MLFTKEFIPRDASHDEERRAMESENYNKQNSSREFSEAV
jgi:hypothetical protein